MRNFHAMPLPGVEGSEVAGVAGDGPSHLMTVTPGGVIMEPLFPSYEEAGSKNEYKVLRAKASQGQLRAAGSP